MTAIVQVEHLVKRYKRSTVNAVDDISFVVEPGEFFTLLGPNGAGKTTTISILTTTLSPTGGAVQIAGFDALRQSSEVRRCIGIIFQQPSLDLNLTAEENVRLHAVMYGLTPFRPTFSLMPSDYKRQVQYLAGVLGIEEEIFQPVRTFSGGMKRKLEIVRSLIHNPSVLFLDEPTSGLDPTSRRNLWEYLRQVRRESGTTIFLTTHYLDESEQADKVCILNHGKIVSFGTPAEIKAELVQNYIVLDAQDRDRLRHELNQLGITFQEVPAFRIALDALSPQQILRAVETPLTLVQTHMPTLEDAYVSIIGDDHDGR